MTRLLAAVERTARRKRRSADEYRAAVVAARAAGHTLTEIGRAAGTSFQAVAILLRRHANREEET